MKRYEWKMICEALNCWGYWDNVKHEYLIETTAYGMKVYKELGFN